MAGWEPLNAAWSVELGAAQQAIMANDLAEATRAVAAMKRLSAEMNRLETALLLSEDDLN